MLQRMRQHRSLHAVISTALLLALLTALFLNAPTRMALEQFRTVDICSTTMSVGAHGTHDGAEAPARHAHHHAPDCLLCFALATPPAVVLAVGLTLFPLAHQARLHLPAIVPAWRARAPLPARGPPDSFHA